MQLDAVEAGRFGILGTPPELFDDARKLAERQRARRHHLLRTPGREHLTLRSYCRGRDRKLAVVEIRVRDASDMPELEKDFAARTMHRFGNSRPTGNLLAGMDARHADIADTLGADLRRFGDDQSRGGALGVVGCGGRVRDVVLKRAAAGHRRHHQAIVEFDVSQLIGQKQWFKRLLGLGTAVRNSGIHLHGMLLVI